MSLVAPKNNNITLTECVEYCIIVSLTVFTVLGFPSAPS